MFGALPALSARHAALERLSRRVGVLAVQHRAVMWIARKAWSPSSSLSLIELMRIKSELP